MKYSSNFERDFKWFLSMRHNFTFDGVEKYFDKKGNEIIVPDKNGVSGKEAFYFWDSSGKIKSTKHPNLLHTLLKTKGSINLHIQMYAEDRASALLSLVELRGMCIKWKAPEWFRLAVEHQKVKYWDKYLNLA